ncbi:MAG: amino acid adenylation domain-containing protein, partial [Tumebacillaceae bacterium]
EMVVGMLAVLKAGGAYVPLDSALPAERLRYMMEDAQMPWLLTQEHLLSVLPQERPTTFCLDGDWGMLMDESEANPDCVTDVDNLFYVIYTSGTTGHPKGVALGHRGPLNLIKYLASVSPLATGDGFSMWTSFGFDVSVYEIFSALCFGGRLHFVPDAVRAESVSYFKWLQEQDIQVSYVPPFMVKDLANWIKQEGNTLPLRRLLVGVEPIQEHLLVEIGRALPGLIILNGYGPTEASIASTIYQVDPSEMHIRNAPIGRPVANTTAYVLDSRLQPVPTGVAGEVYIGGVGLARGYLNRADLTAEKFVANPFAEKKGERLYKTGDLARYLADGNIEFVGRVDHQVKVRGFRIELGEIEAVLAQHADVTSAVVLVREDVPGDKRIVAYVAAEDAEAVTSGELRHAVKARLPEYMVPSAFIVLEAMPLTPNGKVDRRALPAPDWELLEQTYVAPRTSVEETVAGIWADVLHVERVGVQNNFFELGGHSLLATQVISRVNETFDVQLPLRCLFETPTVEGLAVQIGDVEVVGQTLGNTTTQIVPVARDGALPLSFAQQRLWVLERFLAGAPVYNMPYALRLQGALNVSALEKSLNDIIARHESLRTTFMEIAGQPVQVIGDVQFMPLSLIDLRALSAEQQEAETKQHVHAVAQLPFDLGNGPLIRFSLLQLGEAEHVLTVNMHHIVSDGWSTGVFVREFVTLYEAYSQGQASPLVELPIQYADFATWQRDWMQGDVLEGHLAYWKHQLRGELPILQLPIDRPRPSVQTYRGAVERFTLPSALTDGLQALSNRQGATLFMTLLAAYQTLLGRYSGQDDVLVGTPIAGRTQRETEGLIGFFVNTLVMRADLSGMPSFAELVDRVREMTLGAYAHQDVP